MPLDSRKVLAFSAAAEIATGAASMVVPVVVVDLLLGTALTGIGIALGRCFGIVLIALGVACWPGRQQAASPPPAVRAMLIYNTLIALYLAYLFAVRHHSGVLLWPAVALHAAVALLLTLALQREGKARATGQ